MRIKRDCSNESDRAALFWRCFSNSCSKKKFKFAIFLCLKQYYCPSSCMIFKTAMLGNVLKTIIPLILKIIS